MLKAQFIDILKEPRIIDSAQLVELENIVKEYPFFESAHLLYTKGLHKYNALNYSRQLRKTAIVANSRAVLYELLHPKEILVKQSVQEAPVIQEEIITATIQPAEPVTEPEQKQEEATPKELNPVTITNTDIKVVYVTTVSRQTEPATEKTEEKSPIQETTLVEPIVEEPVITQESAKNEEIGIIQAIENETDAEVTQAREFNEEQLNQAIGQEITRGVIQSYIETEVLKTPELQKDANEDSKPLSFTDWLNRVKAESGTISKTELKPVQEPEKSTPKEQKQPKTEKKPSNLEQNKNIIDKIIESDPGRIRLGATKFFIPATEAKQSLLENEHLVTETLAKIYALQGNISKAIRAYEILSLKFPQKSVYFASLIEKLKK